MNILLFCWFAMCLVCDTTAEENSGINTYSNGHKSNVGYSDESVNGKLIENNEKPFETLLNNRETYGNEYSNSQANGNVNYGQIFGETADTQPNTQIQPQTYDKVDQNLENSSELNGERNSNQQISNERQKQTKYLNIDFEKIFQSNERPKPKAIINGQNQNIKNSYSSAKINGYSHLCAKHNQEEYDEKTEFKQNNGYNQIERKTFKNGAEVEQTSSQNNGHYNQLPELINVNQNAFETSRYSNQPTDYDQINHKKTVDLNSNNYENARKSFGEQNQRQYNGNSNRFAFEVVPSYNSNNENLNRVAINHNQQPIKETANSKLYSSRNNDEQSDNNNNGNRNNYSNVSGFTEHDVQQILDVSDRTPDKLNASPYSGQTKNGNRYSNRFHRKNGSSNQRLTRNGHSVELEIENSPQINGNEQQSTSRNRRIRRRSRLNGRF